METGRPGMGLIRAFFFFSLSVLADSSVYHELIELVLTFPIIKAFVVRCHPKIHFQMLQRQC